MSKITKPGGTKDQTNVDTAPSIADPMQDDPKANCHVVIHEIECIAVSSSVGFDDSLCL